MATAKKKDSAAGGDKPDKWPFGKKNYIMFGIALVTIIVGFILLAQGSITLAPILLVIGYGLIPFAIMARGKPEETQSEPGDLA